MPRSTGSASGKALHLLSGAWSGLRRPVRCWSAALTRGRPVVSRLDEDWAPPLVGRRAERELLSAFPARLADGPAALLLLGDPGIGKTSLWLDAIRSAAPRATVLTARPAELSRRVAFSGLSELFEGRDEQVDELPAPGQHALHRALGRGIQRGSVEAADVAQAAAALLAELACSRPVVLAID